MKMIDTLKSGAGVVGGACKRSFHSAVTCAKPVARSAVRATKNNPEVVVFGGLGFAAGKFLDGIPLLGMLTGGNAKWVGAVGGGMYGHARSLHRRKIDLMEKRLEQEEWTKA